MVGSNGSASADNCEPPLENSNKVIYIAKGVKILGSFLVFTGTIQEKYHNSERYPILVWQGNEREAAAPLATTS